MSFFASIINLSITYHNQYSYGLFSHIIEEHYRIYKVEYQVIFRHVNAKYFFQFDIYVAALILIFQKLTVNQ